MTGMICGPHDWIGPAPCPHCRIEADSPNRHTCYRVVSYGRAFSDREQLVRRAQQKVKLSHPPTTLRSAPPV